MTFSILDATGARAPESLVVSTSGLTRDYRGAGLFDVDLRVPRGAVYGLVGLNGAGKTTLVSLLTGTRRADRGQVRLDVPTHRIAVCPDVPEFDPWLTAFEVVDLARSMTAPEADADRITAALTTSGLAEAAKRRVGGFSRGMAQRLALACALVADPDLLILDEPTSALDPAGRAEMLDLIAGMRGRRTVIISSHILADVQRVADHVGILRAGRLLYQGPTRDLLEAYLQPRWLLRVAPDPAAVSRSPPASGPSPSRSSGFGPGRSEMTAFAARKRPHREDRRGVISPLLKTRRALSR
jgi:ABC-2 type transport system ATP-binding protein